MYPKLSLVIGSVFIALAVVSTTPMIDSALAACSATDKVNNTTAADAVKHMEAAGYTQVKILAKGCDNAWHASAVLNGNPVFVVWNAEGQVLPEGN